jgi:hypothetical protein
MLETKKKKKKTQKRSFMTFFFGVVEGGTHKEELNKTP